MFYLRYNMERLSNDMNRVVRLTNWRDPIEEAYFPKLDNIVANRVWPPRPANTRLSVIFLILCTLNVINVQVYALFYYYLNIYFCIQQNINRETERIQFDIEDLERWRDRIFNAIHSGFITDVIIRYTLKFFLINGYIGTLRITIVLSKLN